MMIEMRGRKTWWYSIITLNIIAKLIRPDFKPACDIPWSWI